jgi:hypothetical protein
MKPLLHSKVFFTFFALLFLGCKEQAEKKYTLREVTQVAFPVDTLMNSIQFDIQIYHDTLIILNKDRNMLHFYDIENQKPITATQIPREGKDGVSNISNFLYCHRDSIFLLNAYDYKLYLMSARDGILHKYNLANGKNNDIATGKPNFMAPMVKIGNQLHIATTPYLKPERKDFYKAHKIHQVLDLKTGESKFLPVSCSKTYEKPYPSDFSSFFRVFNEDKKKFVYSFMADDYLMTTAIDGGNIAYVTAKVDVMKSPLQLSSFTDDDAIHKSVQEKSNNYLSILYDKYRKVYYRFAQEVGENQTNLYVIVLDDDFNKILEQKITAIPKDSGPTSLLPPFVAKKGLYIPIMQSKTEDSFKMAIFELQKR